MAGGGDNSVRIDLSDGQLLKVAQILHLQEKEKLKELKFNSYQEQQTYLKDSKAAFEDVESLMSSVTAMKRDAAKDAKKRQIAADIYEYAIKGIGTSVQLIRSYNTRLIYLRKLRTHAETLIAQLHALDPVTQIHLAQRLALEANTYKKATLQHARKFQHFVPNQFTKWLKDTGMRFEDLVRRYMSELGLGGPFRDLNNIQKLQVYERIIEAAGGGKTVVTYTFQALGAVGVAFLVFTAGIMVWDIYTAENKVEAAVRNSVSALIPVVTLVVGNLANTAIAAGFRALSVEATSVAVTVTGAVVGFGLGVVIGMAAGALLDEIFSSGSSQVNPSDGLMICRVAPMPDGSQVSRLVKHNYPNL